MLTSFLLEKFITDVTELWGRGKEFYLGTTPGIGYKDIEQVVVDQKSTKGVYISGPDKSSYKFFAFD
jgi:hypothetical protein